MKLESEITKNIKNIELMNKPNNKPMRTIRSFVCRNKALSPKQQDLFQRLLPSYEITYERVAYESVGENGQHQTISPKHFFIQQSPIVLEIGFGNGESLFEMARNYPDQNFIGIEIYRLGIVHLLTLLEKEPLPNLKLFYGDAKELLQHLEPASLNKIQIFYPDPWPKLRHHKRRLIQSCFVNQLAEKLQPGGILHLATDWQDYARHTMKILLAEKQFTHIYGNDQKAHRIEQRPFTKYEQRGTRLGHESFDLIFQKTTSPSA